MSELEDLKVSGSRTCCKNGKISQSKIEILLILLNHAIYCDLERLLTSLYWLESCSDVIFHRILLQLTIF